MDLQNCKMSNLGTAQFYLVVQQVRANKNKQILGTLFAYKATMPTKSILHLSDV